MTFLRRIEVILSEHGKEAREKNNYRNFVSMDEGHNLPKLRLKCFFGFLFFGFVFLKLCTPLQSPTCALAIPHR